MPATSSSKYSENQFLNATTERNPLLNEVLADAVIRAGSATAGIAAFTPVMTALLAAAEAWQGGAVDLANAEATLPGRTLAFTDYMAGLTRKPDADTSSPLEIWDNIIRANVAYQGPSYMILLPHGREYLTKGTKEEQLDALHYFESRLQEQTTKPELMALAEQVADFISAARALRDAQIAAKSALETARNAQEANRVTAAAALYALVGQGMVTWSTDPGRVDTLFDVEILRNPAQAIPAAPADTDWDPALRSLSTTALPLHATRLQAWRVGPGGMPELLITGATGETTLTIPATITFLPGSTYQFWLTALNSRGASDPGPIQTWTAPSA